MRAYNAGARPQRLLWASTGAKDPKASDLLYVQALAAPFMINTMPEGTLRAPDAGASNPLFRWMTAMENWRDLRWQVSRSARGRLSCGRRRLSHLSIRGTT
jgi:hypothetical protein